MCDNRMLMAEPSRGLYPLPVAPAREGSVVLGGVRGEGALWGLGESKLMRSTCTCWVSDIVAKNLGMLSI